MRKDYHLHTEVSDGRWLPTDIFRTAARLGIDEISITDHDAVGAYIHFGDVRRDAAAAGIRLVPGVELDSAHGGVEIHMLGYELDPVHPGLTAYLGEVQRLRRDRLQALVGRINDALDAPALDAAAVFRPWRDTCMMPHLIQPLLVDGRFPDYRTAKRWIKET
ncbi:MAG: PHP domain-containing protein, partial [Acidobacteria bacterium]|nr:PHP domain-containing protein [Acidobacteriota bacterium]